MTVLCLLIIIILISHIIEYIIIKLWRIIPAETVNGTPNLLFMHLRNKLVRLSLPTTLIIVHSLYVDVLNIELVSKHGRDLKFGLLCSV